MLKAKDNHAQWGEAAKILAGLKFGDGPRGVCVPPSNFNCDCRRGATSTAGSLLMNVHAKSRLTLESLRTLRPEAKGQAEACPDGTRAIPARCERPRSSFHDPEYTRNESDHPMYERSSSIRQESQNSPDRIGGLRSRERARRVPDDVVDRWLSRALPDNTTGAVTWLGTRRPVGGGDLTRKRSGPGMAPELRRAFPQYQGRFAFPSEMAFGHP
jgi:hypothetical protein